MSVDVLRKTKENFIFENGGLYCNIKELIAVATSVLMRCEFCVDVHS
jgi:alkylhydroperoxidase/carboxymuconolactone decarboxylase family protein YurZ